MPSRRHRARSASGRPSLVDAPTLAGEHLIALCSRLNPPPAQQARASGRAWPSQIRREAWAEMLTSGSHFEVSGRRISGSAVTLDGY